MSLSLNVGTFPASASSMAFVVLLLVLTIIVVTFRRMEKAKQS